MIKLMEKEHTHTLMVLTTMETGSMISSMDSVWSRGPMVQSMKVTMSTVRKKVRASSPLLMEVSMKESSNKMKYVVMESTRGLMVNSMKVSGAITRCMEKELLFGKIRKNTKDLLSMTSVRDMVLSAGQMAVNMLENGNLESSMAKAHT